MTDEIRDDEQPRKRIRLDGPESKLVEPSIRADVEKERRVGITAYVNTETSGFSGVLKQR